MGFSEHFGRQGEGESNLQYDDSAFNFFFVSVLITICIPLGFSIVKSLFYNPTNTYFKNNKFEKIPMWNDKLKQLRKQHTQPFFNITNIVKISIFVLFVWTINKIDLETGEEIKRFDPYEILEISPGADNSEIKRAYRRLSRIWHPDKSDEADANAKFIMIGKAYECLTDEKKRHICEKFGNPDGPGSFQLAIAMPSFLLNKDNHVAILTIFFVLLLVVIPTIVILWYQEVSKYDEFGMLHDNKQIFFPQLHENLTPAAVPQILASAMEFDQIHASTQEEGTRLKKIFQIVECEIKTKKTILELKNWKTILLIFAHVTGEGEKQLIKMNNKQITFEEYSKKDHDYIAKNSPGILQALINFTIQFSRRLPREHPLYNRMKFMGQQCLATLIDTQQFICQGLWTKDIPMHQLTYYRYGSARGRKINQKLFDLVKQPREQRNLSFINDGDKDILNDELDMFPRVKVDYEVCVEDENQISEEDILMIRVTLTRENQKTNGVQFGYCYKYPYLKEEKWHVYICSDRNVLFYTCLQSLTPTMEFTQKFREPAGDYKWQLYVRPDCYRGLDQEFEIKFRVLKDHEVKRETYIHPDDEALDKEPSLFNKLMSQVANQQDSEDEDETEESNINVVATEKDIEDETEGADIIISDNGKRSNKRVLA